MFKCKERQEVKDDNLEYLAGLEKYIGQLSGRVFNIEKQFDSQKGDFAEKVFALESSNRILKNQIDFQVKCIGALCDHLNIEIKVTPPHEVPEEFSIIKKRENNVNQVGIKKYGK